MVPLFMLDPVATVRKCSLTVRTLKKLQSQVYGTDVSVQFCTVELVAKRTDSSVAVIFQVFWVIWKMYMNIFWLLFRLKSCSSFARFIGWFRMFQNLMSMSAPTVFIRQLTIRTLILSQVWVNRPDVPIEICLVVFVAIRTDSFVSIILDQSLWKV